MGMQGTPFQWYLAGRIVCFRPAMLDCRRVLYFIHWLYYWVELGEAAGMHSMAVGSYEWKFPVLHCMLQYHDGHKIWAYGMLYYQVPLSAGEFSSKVPWLFFSGAVIHLPTSRFHRKKKIFPCRRSVVSTLITLENQKTSWLRHPLNFCSWNFTRNQKIVWCKSSQLGWNSAAFVIYKSRQTRQEINKLLPLGARWIPATSNPWMIFSQSMFSEQFRWSILPKSQPEEAQETVRNARNPCENWWFLSFLFQKSILGPRQILPSMVQSPKNPQVAAHHRMSTSRTNGPQHFPVGAGWTVGGVDLFLRKNIAHL